MWQFQPCVVFTDEISPPLRTVTDDRWMSQSLLRVPSLLARHLGRVEPFRMILLSRYLQLTCMFSLLAPCSSFLIYLTNFLSLTNLLIPFYVLTLRAFSVFCCLFYITILACYPCRVRYPGCKDFYRDSVVYVLDQPEN